MASMEAVNRHLNEGKDNLIEGTRYVWMAEDQTREAEEKLKKMAELAVRLQAINPNHSVQALTATVTVARDYDGKGIAILDAAYPDSQQMNPHIKTAKAIGSKAHRELNGEEIDGVPPLQTSVFQERVGRISGQVALLLQELNVAVSESAELRKRLENNGAMSGKAVREISAYQKQNGLES